MKREKAKPGEDCCQAMWNGRLCGARLRIGFELSNGICVGCQSAQDAEAREERRRTHPYAVQVDEVDVSTHATIDAAIDAARERWQVEGERSEVVHYAPRDMGGEVWIQGAYGPDGWSPI